MHLLPAGFVAILDFLHLLAYLYDAAHAYRGADAARGWKTYTQWLRWAWSGKVGLLLSGLRAAATELANKGPAAAARTQTVRETLTYVSNKPRADEVSGVPPLGPADQQRSGRVDDQANQTVGSKGRKNSGSKAAPKPCSNCGLPNSVRTTAGRGTGNVPANTAGPPAPAASPRRHRLAETGMHPLCPPWPVEPRKN